MAKKRWKLLGGAIGCVVLLLFVPSLFRDPEESNALSFQATAIEATNNSSSTAAHSSSANNMFLAQKIGVISESEHPVMNEVAKKLIQELNALPFVEKAERLTMENRPEAGALLHDLYILLEMPEFDSKGLLATGRKVKAKITGSIGRNIWNSRTRVHDHYSASLVDPYINIELEHKSTTRGIESPNMKYAKVAENISEQINSKVLGQLNQYASKFHVPGLLPPGLYPAYRPTPGLPEPWSERLVEVLNGRGFMLHNHTIHTMLSTQPYEDLKETRALLKERGWRLDSKKFENDPNSNHRFRATMENLAVEAFEVHDRGVRKRDEPVRIVFIYSDRMTQQEVAAAFQEAYGEGEIPVEQWIVFERALPKTTNERMLEGYAERNDLPFEAERFVIQYLKRLGRHDEAVERLETAAVKALLHGHEAVTEVKKLGRDITADKKWEPEEPTIEEIKALGVQVLAVNDELEVDVSTGQSTLLMNDDGEESEILNVAITRSQIPEGRYTLSTSTYSVKNKSSQSSGITPHGKEAPWQTTHHDNGSHASWEIHAEEIGSEQFKLIIKRYQ